MAYKFDYLEDIRASRRPSPYYPSLYFITAIKGRSSTAVSMLSSFISDGLGEGKDYRKIIRKVLLSRPESKEEFRKTLSSKAILGLANPVLKVFNPVVFALKSRRYWKASCECNHVNLVFKIPQMEGLKLDKAIEFNDRICEFEKKFFAHRNKMKSLEGARHIQRYLLIPEDFEKLLDVLDMDSKSDLQEMVSFLDLVKVLNLYSDLTVRLGVEFSGLYFFKSSKPGSFTHDFFDDLLKKTDISSWTGFIKRLAANTCLDVDDKGFRDQRSGRHLISNARLDAILSELNAQNGDYFGYFVAYCVDWHYRRLGPELKSMVDSVPINERMNTAVSRWEELMLKFCPNLPLPK